MTEDKPLHWGKKMIRFVTIATFAASLLLWSTQVSADSPTTSSGESPVTANAAPPAAQHHHVHNHSVQPYPVLNSIGHNLGFDTSRIARFGSGMMGRFRNAASFPLVASGIQQPGVVPGAVHIPAGPPPNGFIGGVFTPQQYQQVSPHPMMAGYAYPPPGPGGLPPGTVASADIPLPGLIDPQGLAAYPAGYIMEEGPPIDQRIVYVPYAMPPPIHVERLAKALPRPPLMRRALGDATLYEYPEMPLRMYTTRGPRDFLATNPPSIGY